MKKLIKALAALISSKKTNTATVAAAPADHVYSVQELASMYANQSALDETGRNVLRLAMWDRARRAGYHGYAQTWGNIELKAGIISVLGLVNGVKINNNNGFSFCA